MRQKSVQNFAQSAIASNSIVRTDGYRSYLKGLSDYGPRPEIDHADSELLHWLHSTISNATASILGMYHGLPKKNRDLYWAEFCFHNHPTVKIQSVRDISQGLFRLANQGVRIGTWYGKNFKIVFNRMG